MRSRLLEFEKLRNTRDLGGMQGRDGRFLRSGKLIRSGQLVALPENDKTKLSGLIDTVVDMRTDGEREAWPDSVIEGCTYHHVPIVDRMRPGISREVKNVEELVDALMFKPDISLDYMCNLYRQFILTDHSVREYSKFVHILLDEHDKAILWHCTAGKDRAGTSAIIVEKLLGVSDEDILKDYLDTNENIKDAMLNVVSMVKKKANSDSPLIDKSIGYLFGADEAYLDAFFSAMDERFGGFDAFVHKGLGLGDSDLIRLENLYLD